MPQILRPDRPALTDQALGGRKSFENVPHWCERWLTIRDQSANLRSG
jgi:hypothetical protein